MATAEELSEWLREHYGYELLMLRYTHRSLPQANHQLEWNTYFESCAMHARNLRDFYCGKGKNNTRKASDYCGSNVAQANEQSGAFIKINEQMDHPSTNRATDAEGGKLTARRMIEIVAWLEATHAVFIEKCDPKKKQGWDEKVAIPPLSVTVAKPQSSATNHLSILTMSFGGGVEKTS